jgi:hypothetical protein
MAHFKLNDSDETFLKIPDDGILLFTGASGTETWIEREYDVVVRIGIKSVATATANAATLGVRIDIGEDSAKGQDGPAPAETQLHASQAVQVLVKAGQRLAIKAYPHADNAQILRTVVWAGDLPSAPASRGIDERRQFADRPAANGSSDGFPEQPANQPAHS